MSIQVCPRDSEPVLLTFGNPGAEWLCVVCGWKGRYGLFSARETEATPEAVARRDALMVEYEEARGIAPPDQNRPRPSCMGCGQLGEGRLDDWGKPPHWYVRIRNGGPEYACSRACAGGEKVRPW